jgi:hypothetical protein
LLRLLLLLLLAPLQLLLLPLWLFLLLLPLLCVVAAIAGGATGGWRIGCWRLAGPGPGRRALRDDDDARRATRDA